MIYLFFISKYEAKTTSFAILYSHGVNIRQKPEQGHFFSISWISGAYYFILIVFTTMSFFLRASCSSALCNVILRKGYVVCIKNFFFPLLIAPN